MDILSQKTMPWGNELLGTSKYYIHAYGSALTSLAEILGMTPSEVNEKLKSVDGFVADKDGEIDQIIWEKIVAAFPEWSAQFIEPYNNETVLDALSKGQFVIVLTANSPLGDPELLHAVRYMGNGICHDPFTGTERPTLDFPDVKSFIVLTHNMSAVSSEVPAGVAENLTETAPVAEPTIEQSAPVDPVAAEPTPESHIDPEPSLAVTLANLPAHEKQAVINQIETALGEVKKLLGL